MLVHFRVYGLPPSIFIQGLAFSLRPFRIEGCHLMLVHFRVYGLPPSIFMQGLAFSLRPFRIEGLPPYARSFQGVRHATPHLHSGSSL